MRLFKNIDKKIEEIGFAKIMEDEHGVEYERRDEKYNYTQCVSILHKSSGKHILQSYDQDPGNTCVGLTGYEMKLFYKKMKQLGKAYKRR